MDETKPGVGVYLWTIWKTWIAGCTKVLHNRTDLGMGTRKIKIKMDVSWSVLAVAQLCLSVSRIACGPDKI
jgi:hypothetical protein